MTTSATAEKPMKYLRFEELPVWNDAIALAVRLLGIGHAGRLSGIGDLKSQLERSAISISNNIAEGFERRTNAELVTFLFIAKGSAGEVRSMLYLLANLPWVEGLAADIEELIGHAENISRQLGRWIESLKDSDYKGARYQNTRTRQGAEATRRRDTFLDKIRDVQDEAIRAGPSHYAGQSGLARQGDFGDAGISDQTARGRADADPHQRSPLRVPSRSGLDRELLPRPP
jgi:four helix bundle protein